MHCMTCGRAMVIARGNICLSCDESVRNKREARDTQAQIAETLGEFSMFEIFEEPERPKFKRKNIKKRKIKMREIKNDSNP